MKLPLKKKHLLAQFGATALILDKALSVLLTTFGANVGKRCERLIIIVKIV